MPRKYRFVFIALLALAAFGFKYYQRQPAASANGVSATHSKPVPPAPPRMYGHLAFKPCTLASQFGTLGVEAQCGSMDVPENPAAPSGRMIALNIAWIPADDGADVLSDPVLLLAGGPGQAATESYPQVAGAFRDVLRHRHVLLIDQRGTGRSNPLGCKEMQGDNPALEGSDAPDVLRASAAQCRDRLSKIADLRYYTTTDAVRDLESVRLAIGAPQFNLLGVSYGTRVAQQYARTFPKTTRTLVLDSVAPNRLILGNDFARNLENALDLQFARCNQLPACKQQLGDPRAQLDALMAKLRTAPAPVRLRDPTTGALREETLTADDVIGVLRMYAYLPMVASLLPLQLHEAAQGRYEGLKALAEMLKSSLSAQLMQGMQLSVACAEDAAGMHADPNDADTLLGNAVVEGLAAQCQVWPKGAMPADFHAPLRSAVPTLVLEGEFDPVTPPRYGEEVIKTLPNARLLVLRGQGHNVIGVGCMPRLFAQFIDSANAKTLDAKCLDAIPYAPPFISFNGWQP